MIEKFVVKAVVTHMLQYRSPYVDNKAARKKVLRTGVAANWAALRLRIWSGPFYQLADQI